MKNIAISKTTEYIRKLMPDIDKFGHIIKLCETMNVPLLRLEVAQFLRTFVSIYNPKKILEIGMGIGFSGHILLDKAASNCKLYTIELNEEYVKIAKQLFDESSLKDRVTIWQGDARDIVPNIDGCFDMILMDGPKSCYYYFLDDFKRLLKMGGVLICDNVLFMGNISGETVSKESTLIRNMRAFLQEINTATWISSVLDIGDGVSISHYKGD